MKMKGFSIQKICILVGICLLVGAIVILALWRWNINNSEKRAQYYVNTLQELMIKLKILRTRKLRTGIKISRVLKIKVIMFTEGLCFG